MPVFQRAFLFDAKMQTYFKKMSIFVTQNKRGPKFENTRALNLKLQTPNRSNAAKQRS